MELEELSVVEKAAMLSGGSEWDSRGNSRAGIPSFVMSDGPHGVRRQLGEGDHLGIGASKPATCFPTAGTVANSWDPALAEEMGEALGKEAHDLDVNVLLGPGMNIKRNPLCGRNFEYYSEDPVVAGRMAAGLIRGIQSNGVSACPKHFAVNSQELRRQASNSVIDERTMRELYLTGFEIAVREAGPMTIMTSYNEINGVYAHENKHLLQEILRDEWGFDGMIMTDWGGGQSTPSISMHAGNDLIMPGSSVEDITIRGFSDEEPTFADDDIYPVVNVAESWGGLRATTQWGEFVLDAAGDVTIEKTVDTSAYEEAVRDSVNADGEQESVKVSDLISGIGDAATVTDNGDGTTTIVYTGYYKENNITLGDLQKSTINILNLVMQSNQFAYLFDDVESQPYTEAHSDNLVTYVTNEKGDVE